MFRPRLTVLCAALLALYGASGRAASPSHSCGPAYGVVTLSARVLDRLGHPVVGVAVRLIGDLDGTCCGPDGESHEVTDRAEGVAVTDAEGFATLPVIGPVGDGSTPWFDGWANVHAELAVPDPVLTPLPGRLCTDRLHFPAVASVPRPDPLTLHVFEPPTWWVGGFPVWPAVNGRLNRIVVVLEGFDPYHLLEPGELMRRMGPVGDALRGAGVSLMVVAFPQSYLSPDAQAPDAARAIRAAAAASGHMVTVVGCSEGGLIARWALVTAERASAPLPVSTYISLDVPNRGANMNPGLQEMVLRYGKPEDRAVVSSEAARAMMACRAKNVAWRRVGLPGADRAVPVAWEDDATDCRAFLGRLRALGGYPRRCRLVAVANSPRVGTGGGPELLHLWLPWTYAWTLAARAEDRAPGSLLPDAYSARFTVRMPFGIAGVYLRCAPTFIPSSSALDAAPGETPPFDAWYARPDDSPPVAHDQLAPDVGEFLVRELLRDTSGNADSSLQTPPMTTTTIRTPTADTKGTRKTCGAHVDTPRS